MRSSSNHPIVVLALALALAVATTLFAPGARGQVSTKHFAFESIECDGVVAQQLSQTAERLLREVSGTLGVIDMPQKRILVRIFGGKEAFQKALGGTAQGEWAAGIAMPRASLILLRIDHRTRFDIGDVFKHEISHVVLGRAVGHRPLPYWFLEGIAVHQAGERLLTAWQRSSDATLGDDLIPFEHLTNGFPRDGRRADLAYAQSTAFLAYLIRTGGWGGIRMTIQRVREGATFRRAFERSFGRTVGDAETAWREELSRSASWIPLLTNTTVLWTLSAVIFLWAWWAVRARNRRRLRAMAEHPEDDDDDEFA